MNDISFDEVDMPDGDVTDEPAVTEPSDQSPDRCKDCGAGLTYGGRGPRPKRCKPGEGCRETQSPRTTGSTGRRKGAAWQEPLRNALTSNLAGIGLVVMAFNQVDGTVIMQGAPRLSDSLVGVAETNANVRKALEAFVTAGAWSGVVMASAAIVVPILANHGYLPGALAQSMGVGG